jgi:hypothetical protein
MERGSGMSQSPDLPQVPDTQPVQAPQTKQEQMRAYKRVYNSQWRKDHPERAKQIANKASQKYRASTRGKEYQRNYGIKRWQRKKAEAKAIKQQQAAEQWGNLPPLNPIWDRLARALEKQQTAPTQETIVFPKPSDTSTTSQSPTPERPPTS